MDMPRWKQLSIGMEQTVHKETLRIVGAAPAAKNVDRVSTTLTQNTPIVALASTSTPVSTPKPAATLVAKKKPTVELASGKTSASAVSLQSVQKTDTRSKPTSKTAVQLNYPSFAIGTQQYEPAFTYVFK